MAIACLRLVTFFLERPDRSVPRFRSSIARFTICCACFPYSAMGATSVTVPRPLQVKDRRGGFERATRTLRCALCGSVVLDRSPRFQVLVEVTPCEL